MGDLVNLKEIEARKCAGLKSLPPSAINWINMKELDLRCGKPLYKGKEKCKVPPEMLGGHGRLRNVRFEEASRRRRRGEEGGRGARDTRYNTVRRRRRDGVGGPEHRSGATGRRVGCRGVRAATRWGTVTACGGTSAG